MACPEGKLDIYIYRLCVQDIDYQELDERATNELLEYEREESAPCGGNIL